MIRQAAVLWLTGLIASSAGAQELGRYAVRDSAEPCLNIREEPDTDAAPFACLTPGAHLTVLGVVPYWRSVRLEDGREGFVAKKFIEPLVEPTLEPAPEPLPDTAWLEVHFVDVGQGDAIWILTHDDGIDGNGIFEGRSIVIDGGPYSADSSNPLLPYLRDQAHHGAVLDAVILTHPHIDHYFGAETLARHFDIRDYYDPGFESANTTYAAFISALRGTETEPPQAERLHIGREQFGELDWGREVVAEILYAWPGEAEGLGSGNTLTNNASIVLALTYGSHRFLFMGDAEGKDRPDPPDVPRYVERVLLETVPPEKLAATVLKIAHHGSETSSTMPFIEAVHPEVVVVQSGRKSFGGTFLPDASTLRRYCCHDSETRIYRTDQGDEAEGLSGIDAADGDHILIRTNGTRYEVEALEGGEGFTLDRCEPACE